MIRNITMRELHQNPLSQDLREEYLEKSNIEQPEYGLILKNKK